MSVGLDGIPGQHRSRRRRQSFAGDVSDDQGYPSIAAREHVVEIAAHRSRPSGGHVALRKGYAGHRIRQGENRLAQHLGRRALQAVVLGVAKCTRRMSGKDLEGLQIDHLQVKRRAVLQKEYALQAAVGHKRQGEGTGEALHGQFVEVRNRSERGQVRDEQRNRDVKTELLDDLCAHAFLFDRSAQTRLSTDNECTGGSGHENCRRRDVKQQAGIFDHMRKDRLPIKRGV